MNFSSVFTRDQNIPEEQISARPLRTFVTIKSHLRRAILFWSTE